MQQQNRLCHLLFRGNYESILLSFRDITTDDGRTDVGNQRVSGEPEMYARSRKDNDVRGHGMSGHGCDSVVGPTQS